MSSISTGPDNRTGFVAQLHDWAARLMPSSLKQRVVADDKAARAEERKAGLDVVGEAIIDLQTQTAALEHQIQANNQKVEQHTRLFRTALADGDQDGQQTHQIHIKVAQKGKVELFGCLEVLAYRLGELVTDNLTTGTAVALANAGKALARANDSLDIDELSADSKAADKSGKSKKDGLNKFLQGELNKIRGQDPGLTGSISTYTPDPAVLDLVHRQELKEAKARAAEQQQALEAAELAATQRNTQTIGGINQTALQILQGRK